MATAEEIQFRVSRQMGFGPVARSAWREAVLGPAAQLGLTTLSVAGEQLSDYFRVNSNLGGSFPYGRGWFNGLGAVSGCPC